MLIILEPAYVNDGGWGGGPGAINMLIVPESIFPNYSYGSSAVLDMGDYWNLNFITQI